MIDFHFTITPLPEPDLGATHLVEVREWVEAPANDQWPVATLVLTPEPFETHITDDPYGMVEAAREAQAYSLEDRFDMYAARGW